MALPGALCLVLLAIEVPWFAALARELRGNEKYLSVNSWFANPLFLWRPLWLDYLPGLPQRIFSHFNRPETVVSIGCFLSVPAVIAIHRARRRAGGQGLIHLLPFLLFFLFGILYISDAFPWPVQMLLPFMSFFRVASRWGLFFPQLAMILILLSWPDTRGWFKSFPRRHRAWAAVFALSFVGEASLLLDPINALPKIPPAVEQVLRGVKEQPGDTVLDLPFCVAGGNGVCTQEQCPQYPGSIAGQCFRQWHGKKTYGLYQPRMYPSQCEIYERAPFQSWFSAWRENRCFSPGEWTEFCGYLDRQTSLSAVFLYPGIWGAAGRKSCRAQFDQHLGAALGSGEFMTEPTRGALGKDPAAIVWYAPRCRR